jgi:CheY-like chemotaxis protein
MAHGGNGTGRVGGAAGADRSRIAAAQSALRGRRVLVIEDDADIAELWAEVLTASGCEVQRLESALGAVALLRRWRPDVVLLDLGLPYRSGAALLADVTADPETAAIPVVVVSANPESLPLDRRAQAAAVVAKPVQLRVLFTVLVDAIARGAPQPGSGPGAAAGGLPPAGP